MSRLELIHPPQAVIHTPRSETERGNFEKSLDEFRGECSRWHAINSRRWMIGAQWWHDLNESEQAQVDIDRAGNETDAAEYWAARQHLIAWC